MIAIALAFGKALLANGAWFLSNIVFAAEPAFKMLPQKQREWIASHPKLQRLKPNPALAYLVT
jgi:hypothetical protein